jgi:hypothetical protein
MTRSLATLTDLVAAVRQAIDVRTGWTDTAELVADQLRAHLPGPEILTPDQRHRRSAQPHWHAGQPARRGSGCAPPGDIHRIRNVGDEIAISLHIYGTDITRVGSSARRIVMCTAKNARKLPALRRSPAVALTIDTESHPPKVLLIRGQAELNVVDGIPDEYFQWNGTYQMTPEQRAEWEKGVRSLYDGMVRVVVTPTWAKLIDFETTLPTAIEELMQQQKARQRA